MKIAMIGQKGINLIGERTGGIETHVENLAVRLVKFGHAVTVYSRAQYAKDRSSNYQGARLVYLPTIYRKNLEAIVHTFFSTLHALFQRYDVIHYHGVGPATLAWIPRIFSPKTRVVVTFHSQDRFHQKWSPIARAYLFFGEWAAVNFPHACIAVSQVIQKFCFERFNRKTVYIPSGVELQKSLGDNLIKPFGLQKDSYILNVSRLVPHKGQHFLIEAFQNIKTDKKLVIVGAPAFTEDYLTRLKQLAAGNSQIIFLGFQTGDVLKQLYANAYLYVHPSEYEGLSVVVLEAMSHGAAVLTSDIPENKEAIHDAGYTFQSGNVSDLAEKLTELLNHPELISEAREKSRRVVREFYDWDIITKQIEELYGLAR